MENTIHICTLFGNATTGAGNDSGCFNLQTVSTTLPQARWKKPLKCDRAAYPFRTTCSKTTAESLFFLFCLGVEKWSKINVYLTKNPLLTYSGFGVGIVDCVVQRLRKTSKQTAKTCKRHICESDSDWNKLTLSTSMPRTCILIENNQIKPPLQSDIFRWALYLQGCKELPYVRIRERGLIARYRPMIAVALYKNSDVTTPQIGM